MTRRLRSAGRRGTVAVEFAVCGGLLMLLCGATVNVSVLSWAEAALQSVALQTARCAALGAAACPSPSQYALTLVTQWLYSGAVSSSEIAVSSAAACNGATGHYTVVTITAHAWSGSALVGPFAGTVLTASACYPSAL